MFKKSAAAFSACYPVDDAVRVAQIFRSLPEFARGEVQADAEEFHWMVPQYRRGKPVTQSVATVRLTRDKNLQIECANEYTLRAMSVLLDCLIGRESKLRPAEPLHLQSESSQSLKG